MVAPFAALLPVSPPPLRGPAIVVMLQRDCPCAKECHEALNRLAAACAGKMRFVGLVDGDARAAQSLIHSAGLSFPVLADPKRRDIHALGGHEALDLRLVGSNGQTLARWDGLCRANVAALVDAVRIGTGQDVSLDLSPFTVTPKYGCKY